MRHTYTNKRLTPDASPPTARPHPPTHTHATQPQTAASGSHGAPHLPSLFCLRGPASWISFIPLMNAILSLAVSFCRRRAPQPPAPVLVACLSKQSHAPRPATRSSPRGTPACTDGWLTQAFLASPLRRARSATSPSPSLCLPSFPPAVERSFAESTPLPLAAGFPLPFGPGAEDVADGGTHPRPRLAAPLRRHLRLAVSEAQSSPAFGLGSHKLATLAHGTS
jgi:hypothetical protein